MQKGVGSWEPLIILVSGSAILLNGLVNDVHGDLSAESCRNFVPRTGHYATPWMQSSIKAMDLPILRSYIKCDVRFPLLGPSHARKAIRTSRCPLEEKRTLQVRRVGGPDSVPRFDGTIDFLEKGDVA